MSRDAIARWLVIVILVLTDTIWMGFIGLRVGNGLGLMLIAVLVLAMLAGLYSYTRRSREIADFAQITAQFILMFAATVVLSYLAASTNAPLIDASLASLDQRLGLDWPGWFEWVRRRPILTAALAVAYASLAPQFFFCLAHNGLTARIRENRELWWHFTLSLLITIPLSAAFPAASAWVYYQVADPMSFVHMQHFTALREGQLPSIDLLAMQGLVTFPSFHTTAAILLAYALRQRRVLLAASTLLNLVMILSVPTEGGHYFVDVMAGVAVALATIALDRRLHPLLNAETAAASILLRHRRAATASSRL